MTAKNEIKTIWEDKTCGMPDKCSLERKSIKRGGEDSKSASRGDLKMPSTGDKTPIRSHDEEPLRLEEAGLTEIGKKDPSFESDAKLLSVLFNEKRLLL